MAVTENKGNPVFLHTLLAGGASHSFGVAVAKMAGIPEEVINSAQHMLHHLEERNNISHTTNIPSQPKPSQSPSLLIQEVLYRKLQHLDILQMTPLEALNVLAELKENIKMIDTTQEAFLEKD